MSAVAFDTLKLARRLASVGFSREQADGTAEALAETLTGEIATKSDLLDLKAGLKSQIAEVKGEIADLRGELRSEISHLRNDTAKWIIGAVFVNIVTQVGVVVAIWQFTHK